MWRELYVEYDHDATIWPRYLDAAAGTKKLAQRDAVITNEIFDKFEQHETLRNDNSFLTRLIDVMVRVEHAERIYPLSRALYVRAAEQRHDTLRRDFAPELIDGMRIIRSESLLPKYDMTAYQHDEVRLRLANNLHALSHFRHAEPIYDLPIESGAFQNDDQTRGQMMVTAARNSATLGKFKKARRIFVMLGETGISTRAYEVEHAVVLMKTGDEKRGKELLRERKLNLDQMYRLASMYTSAQELALADDVYDEILKHHPDEIVARRRQAAVNVWLKDYAKASRVLRYLLKDHPDDYELLLLLAQAQLRGDEASEARTLLRQLNERQPANAETDLLFLQSIAAVDDFDEVDRSRVQTRLEQYQTEDQPIVENVELPIALAGALDKSGDGDSAIGLLREILDEPAALAGLPEEKRTDIRFRYATLLHRNERYAEAQPELETLEGTIDPEHANAYRDILLISARNLVRLERYKDAIRCFETVRQSNPAAFDLFEEYAGILMNADEIAQALIVLRQAPTLTLSGRYLLSDIYVRQQRFDLASSSFAEILNQYPNELRALRGRADCLTWSEDYRSALPLYEDLMRRDPNSESLQVAYAQALLWSGSHQAALDYFTTVLQANPQRRDLWGHLLDAAGGSIRLTDAARGIVRNILTSEQHWPENLDFKRALSQTLLRIGQRDRAIALLRELLAAEPRSRKARRTLADALHTIGEFEEAEQHYVELLRMGKPEPRQRRRPKRRVSVLE